MTEAKPNQFKHLSLADLPLLEGLRKRHLSAEKEVCIERARWVTKYLRDEADPNDPFIVQYAQAVRHFLRNKPALFFDGNLLPGTTTSKYFGAPVYPELTGILIWPELDTISTRDENPTKLTDEEAQELALDIYPYWMERTILERTRAEYKNPACLRLFEKLVFFIASKAGAISHTVPCYEKVLAQGLEAIIAEAQSKQAGLEGSGTLDAAKRQALDFYRAVQIALDGVLAYADALAKKAAELASRESDGARRQNLLDMESICRKVPRLPAESFREALTALWIAQIAVHAENINMAISPGRVDQLLYSYYQEDKKRGTLTDAHALELAGCFWLKLNDNANLVPQAAEKLFGGAGTAPAVTLGGVDRDGKDAVNELTYLFLRATELLRLRDPNVNARYHYEVNGDDYLERVSEVIAETRAVPAFHNDVADIKTLTRQGLSEAHARDYAIVGCVEITSAGRSYDAPSSIILNLVAPLELTLYDGRRPITGDEQIGPRTGNPGSFASFEVFWEKFAQQLEFVIDQAVTLNNYFGTIHQKALPTPLLSAFFEGPLEQGKDLIFGGATYNSSGATHVGFADTVDSLSAIEQAIFVEEQCSFDDLLAALEHDFQGSKALHAYLVNAPKYGTSHPMARKNAQKLVSLLYSLYQGRTNYRGGRYRPAYWTMTNHAGQGELAGALPNGRKAHKVLASGITPVSQAALDLADCLDAVAALDPNMIPGGEAFNLKFSSMKTADDRKRFGALVHSYFQKGGMQVQFNIMDYHMLIDAMKSPDQYQDLLVRVSGYSAYFNDLTPAMKHEIITRTAYDLCRGEASEYPDRYRHFLPFE